MKDVVAIKNFDSTNHCYLQVVGRGAEEHLETIKLGFLGRVWMWLTACFGCCTHKASMKKVADYVARNIDKLCASNQLTEADFEKLLGKMRKYEKRHHCIRSKIEHVESFLNQERASKQQSINQPSAPPPPPSPPQPAVDPIQAKVKEFKSIRDDLVKVNSLLEECVQDENLFQALTQEMTVKEIKQYLSAATLPVPQLKALSEMAAKVLPVDKLKAAIMGVVENEALDDLSHCQEICMAIAVTIRTTRISDKSQLFPVILEALDADEGRPGRSFCGAAGFFQKIDNSANPMIEPAIIDLLGCFLMNCIRNNDPDILIKFLSNNAALVKPASTQQCRDDEGEIKKNFHNLNNAFENAELQDTVSNQERTVFRVWLLLLTGMKLFTARDNADLLTSLKIYKDIFEDENVAWEVYEKVKTNQFHTKLLFDNCSSSIAENLQKRAVSSALTLTGMDMLVM